MREGEFDIVILTPPCASWTRALFSHKPGPAPCRDAKHPWGFPNALRSVRERARKGNEFVHFTLQLAEAAQVRTGWQSMKSEERAGQSCCFQQLLLVAEPT